MLDHFGYLLFRDEVVTERGKWLADLRIDQTRARSEDLDKRILEQPGCRVEIVDGEILEQAAAARDEVDARRRGIVIDDVQGFGAPDLARIQSTLEAGKVGIYVCGVTRQ